MAGSIGWVAGSPLLCLLILYIGVEGERMEEALLQANQFNQPASHLFFSLSLSFFLSRRIEEERREKLVG